jgi:hypothetical protein
MPAKTLRPNHYTAARYQLAKEGLVTLTLESDIPVKTYIVRPKGLEIYRQGGAFKYYGGFADARRHQQQRVWLPFTGSWYLIISNPDKNRTANLEYEVSF